MAHLRVKNTPTKRKQTSLSTQKNNLLQYFRPSECNALEETGKVTMSSESQLGIKRKLDDRFQPDTQTDEIIGKCCKNKICRPKPQVKEINLSDSNVRQCHEITSKVTTKTVKTSVNYEMENDRVGQQSIQEENVMKTKNLIKESTFVREVNGTAGIEKLSSLVEQSTEDDSFVIDTNNIGLLNTPAPQQQTKNIDEISNINMQNQIKVSAPDFKNIIYSLCYNDFKQPYRKLNISQFPECYDLEKCKTLHDGVKAKEANSFQYGHVFNLLDNPLSEWMCDVLPAISLVVEHYYCLRGDMLRILFDYVLNGPNKDLMWDIKTVLESHWSLHPPCSEHMQNIYLELLDRPFRGESFFKTNLVSSGVLTYILDKLDKILCSNDDVEKDVLEHKNNAETDDQTTNSDEKPLTFEVMEERFKNLQPLFEKEHQEIMDVVDELNCSQVELENVTLDGTEVLDRLTVALELIVDLLEADIMICISRLKHHMLGDCEVQVPLMSHFIDGTSQSRIMKLYMSSKDPKTWKQFSRLISLMAETIHLFKFWGTKLWRYPNIHPECESFAVLVYEWFRKGDWDESECLSRLQALGPPWLKQRVTLAMAISHLNLDLGTGIHALVDIIHTHVVSPVKLENNLKKVELKLEKSKLIPEKYLKKAKKRNQYGETQLHLVCKRNKSTVEDVKCLLSLPETDINARDNYGHTPLHEAIFANNLDKTKVLLQFQPPPGSGRDSVDVGAQNHDGNTPLHEAVAVQDPHLEMCQLLVQYGGICLLRKKNNQGMTPRLLAQDKRQIKDFFESVIKTQEALNLNSNSVLKLSDPMIRMCMIACEAFITDNHTWELYQILKYNKDYIRASPQPYIYCCKDILVEFKRDQDHFRKLRRIIEKLADNPQNSYLVKIWNGRFQYRVMSRGNVS